MGLPLQLSTFSGLAHCLDIFAPSSIAQEPSPIAMDDDGTLFMDRPRLTELARAWVSEATDVVAVALAERLGAAGARLSSQPETFTDSTTAHQRTVDVLDALRAFMPLPIVSKVFAEVMLEDRGTNADPTTSHASSGRRLLDDLVSLSRSLGDLGHSPSKVATEWPDVDGSVVHLVGRFASEHCGYGPLAWEAPGLAEPANVVRALTLTTTSTTKMKASEDRSASGPTGDDPLLDLLTSWVTLMENGIKLVRQTFYWTIRPALPFIAGRLRVAPLDVLFMTADEVVSEEAKPSLIRTRRDSYFADAEYLDRHQIDSHDLQRLCGAA